MSVPHPVVFGLLLSFLALPVRADTLSDWFKRMNAALSGTSYEGVFIYSRDNDVETFSLQHHHRDGDEWERLTAVSGAPREYLRHNQELWCIDTPGKEPRVEEHGVQNYTVNVDDLDRIKTYYRFAWSGEDMVAGRTTRVMQIVPLDEFRYGRIIWFDKETALPLRAELRNSADHVIERMLFTAFHLANGAESTLPKVFPKSSGGQQRTEATDDVVDLARETIPWQFHVPQGFELIEAMRHAHGDQAPIDHFIFDDGLAKLSVFIEKANGNPPESPLNYGALRSASVDKFDHRFTVLGEVPQYTVDFVAERIIPRRP